MPEREPGGHRYIPGLDGIRACAVLAVMAYHSGEMPAGFLGVDSFFVLSGFLITTLLVGEWAKKGSIRLGGFWSRRARRLLPALMVMLLLVAFYARFVVPRGTYPDLRLDAIATLFYFANWHFIVAGSNYFGANGLPSLLTHTWSLSIEEQFYVIWPLVVLGTLLIFRKRGLFALLVISVLGAIASAAEMDVFYHEHVSLTRLYYGTDTHAQCLLVGVALAVGLAMATERSLPSWVAGGIGVAGVVGTGVLWWRASYEASFLWKGGFLLAAIATAAIIYSVVSGGVIGSVLGLPPFRYLGQISYGMYLFHYPLFQWIDGARSHLSGVPLFVLRSAVTIVAASLSFYLIENPIRFGNLLRGMRAFIVTPVAVVCIAAAMVAATIGPAAVEATPLAHHKLPAATAKKAPDLRVLFVGDSTSFTLSFALGEDAATYGITEVNRGILGCGVIEGTQILEHGVVDTFPAPCNLAPIPPGTPKILLNGQPDGQRWTTYDKAALQYEKPNIVMLLAGRWEVQTLVYNGAWTNITNPSFAAYVKASLVSAVHWLSAGGAKVVLLTAPCYSSGEQPTGAPWPADTEGRVNIFNNLVKQTADATLSAVINLHTMVCPGGHYESTIDGIPVRQSDGIHFAETSAPYLGPLIWPKVLSICRKELCTDVPTPKADSPRH